jgi:hypothetical protein
MRDFTGDLWWIIAMRLLGLAVMLGLIYFVGR